MYKTKVRMLIINYLKTNCDRRFTAREIYEAIRDEAGSLNQTTIYRNMDRLCEEGELVRYKEPNRNAWYYQYSEEHRHCNRHMHAQCSTCGKIFHLETPFVDEFTEKIRDQYGLDVSPSETIILGQCRDCGRAENREKSTGGEKNRDAQ
uniref:Fur family transcriptional regulator n=1 Tax=Eubacterium cellulosolvens TaxID=29322 RepID=UPI000684558B|nr:transcriptional repressor [[Eubacterium] cellulosolvens]